jgi:hypothetical protein
MATPNDKSPVLFDLLIPQYIKMLTNLRLFLERAVPYAEARKFDVSVLLSSRLAPDQFPLGRQIQIACDTAKLSSARLIGESAPTHADDEQTLAQFQARIESVIAHLKSLKRDSFAGASERLITQPRWEGKTLTGWEYALQHALPNFYFHVTTAYAILRHNGVEVGKKDFLGPMPFAAPKS